MLTDKVVSTNLNNIPLFLITAMSNRHAGPITQIYKNPYNEHGLDKGKSKSSYLFHRLNSKCVSTLDEISAIIK